MTKTKAITEKEFQTQVIQLARLRGWKVQHQRPARTASGWRTAITGDVGFPDLILLRHDRMIVAELKVGKGRVTTDQENWLLAFGMVADESGRIWTGVWRPEYWKAIADLLE